MAMVAPAQDRVKPPRRQRPESLLGQINDQGYEVVGAMTGQWGDLADICDANALEDQARATLGAILREQERLLSKLGAAGAAPLELNRRAQRKLALVDVLDAEQGLDRQEPLKRARTRNREAHSAGRRIVALTEEPTLRPVA